MAVLGVPHFLDQVVQNGKVLAVIAESSLVFLIGKNLKHQEYSGGAEKDAEECKKGGRYERNRILRKLAKNRYEGKDGQQEIGNGDRYFTQTSEDFTHGRILQKKEKKDGTGNGKDKRGPTLCDGGRRNKKQIINKSRLVCQYYDKIAECAADNRGQEGAVCDEVQGQRIDQEKGYDG